MKGFESANLYVCRVLVITRGKEEIMRVVVIGAGIGGLSAAIGLQRAGAEVTVLERAQQLRPGGSGLSLFANGRRALDALGVGAEVDEIASQAATSLRGGQRRPDGAWLATYPQEALEGLRIVHRTPLHEILVAALAPDTLRLGVEVVAVDERTGTVRTTSGERITGDVVVAADGIRSRVRSAWPEDPGTRYSGYSTWRGVTEHPVDLHGAAGETWGRGERFGLAPLADGRVYWFAVASLPARSRIADEFGEVRRRFGHWHDPIPELLDATDPGTVFRLDIDDLARPLPTFRHGRCVLLGDAAHAMTPDLGQGAGQALEDAATLTALLQPTVTQTAEAIDAALDRYDRLRRRRTQPIARRAHALGQLAHVSSGIGVAVRDTILRLTPPSALGRQIRAVQDWRPPEAA
jgi:2-polyprenyl-6-methoxyphenol hydroxylase-like FAD-dependent oxidoreductase